jgi:hypothetical protein
MRIATLCSFVLLSIATAFSAGDAAAQPTAPTAAQIVEKAIDSDSWGRDGVEATARVTVTERNGDKRELAFEAKSRRYAPQLTKSVLRFSAPADVAGMKFLLVQHKEGDDERTLYMPELKRSRRVTSGNRTERFMGTDFTYADMDRKDVRDGTPVLEPDDKIGKTPCYHLKIAAKPDAMYSRVEVWVRKDNYVPLKWVMFDRAGAPAKTLVAKELQHREGRWQITRSLMADHTSGRSTEILIEHVEPRDVPTDAFTLANLEKP